MSFPRFDVTWKRRSHPADPAVADRFQAGLEWYECQDHDKIGDLAERIEQVVKEFTSDDDELTLALLRLTVWHAAQHPRWEYLTGHFVATTKLAAADFAAQDADAR